MKKFLLSFVILFCIANQKTYSQNCQFTSPTIVQSGFADAGGGNCQLTFKITFDLDHNGGFKYLYLHIWENTDYNFWHPFGNTLYSGNNTQPNYNDGDASDPQNILQDAIFTVPINLNTIPFTFLPDYAPDPDAPIATGAVTETLISGTNYHVEIDNIVVVVPSASLPFGCSGLNLYNGDGWGGNGSFANPVVQCAQQNLTLLPVKLVNFTAVRNGQKVNLAWQTASEDNNQGFDIERKIGEGGWQKIGFVPSASKGGTSNTLLSYVFSDVNISNGVSQYRLKQIDIDRRSTYSEIRAVYGLEQRIKTLVFPNPSNDGKVNVLFDEENVARNIILVDINGRTIKQWRGTTNSTIQMENLTPGFYSLRIINTKTNKQTVEKFIVNKR